MQCSGRGERPVLACPLTRRTFQARTRTGAMACRYTTYHVPDMGEPSMQPNYRAMVLSDVTQVGTLPPPPPHPLPTFNAPWACAAPPDRKGGLCAHRTPALIVNMPWHYRTLANLAKKFMLKETADKVR